MAASPASTERIWFRRLYGSSSVSGPAGVWRGGGTSADGQGRKVGGGARSWTPAHCPRGWCPPPSGLTSIPGEVEAEDVGAVGTEVGQPPQVGLQLPTGQFRLEQQCQVAEDKGVEGGRAAAERGGGMEWPCAARGGEDTVWTWCGGLPRWRQPGPEWDSMPGLHKGHIECSTGSSRAWRPSHPPVPLRRLQPHTQPYCHQTQCLSRGPPVQSRHPPRPLQLRLNQHLLPSHLLLPWSQTHASPKKNL